MNTLLSYFRPQVKTIDSELNGSLHLILDKGKKVLNSSTANYSYGCLQEILETGLAELNLTAVESVLLLGLGGGSVIFSLRQKYNYIKQIHAIEFDPKMIEIAEQEFSIFNSENTNIEFNDAFEFVKQTRKKYDLIIVDLFIDTHVPAQFYSEEFCDNLVSTLSAKGAVIFNLGIFDLNMDQRLDVFSYFQSKKEYHSYLLENVCQTNTLLIIQKLIFEE